MYQLHELKIGMESSANLKIADDIIVNFSELSGDKNPIHLSDTYASQSKFGQRIAHGMISASLFSGIFGSKLPGEGALYISQTLKFHKPVYIGDDVCAKVKIVDICLRKKIVTFETNCYVYDQVVISGQAEIYKD